MTDTYGYAMLQKCHRYLEIGIPVTILIDADEQTVQILRPNRPLEIVRGDQRIDLGDVIPGFDLTAQALFRDAIPNWLRPLWGQADDAAASERSGG